ncbi:hypothetical protein M426DRAFT_317152 [Hypoxylon sp. CI-4A]|nr:hypothetical protein M426DRAFT_317152 [Hypoxylon sp. CI-4A]
MAVLDHVPGIEVTVQVNGRTATEYDPPDIPDDEEEAIATKYIECIDGANFSIDTRVTWDYDWGYRNHMLKFRYYVDGAYTRGKVIDTSKIRNGVASSLSDGRRSYCPRTHQWVHQRYQFSAINTVDDATKERIEHDMETAKDLGCIEVRVTRTIYLGKSSSRPSKHKRNPIENSDLEISEKSLKGKATSHGTSYSHSTRTHAPISIHVEDIEEDGGPIAIYRFYYRSRDALKREMVIPRSPSPPAPEIARMSRAS